MTAIQTVHGKDLRPLIPALSPQEIRQLKDQTKLAKIALTADILATDCVTAAIGNITDPILLARIAIACNNRSGRFLAASKLEDQDLLMKVGIESQSDSDSGFYRYVVERIWKEDRLSEVALKAKNSMTRYWAIKRICNQILLANIAIASKDRSHGLEIVERLDDKKLLLSIASKSPYREVRLAAKKKSEDATQLSLDQSFLAKAAIESRSKDAVNKLFCQEMLAKVALESEDAVCVSSAIDKLDQPQLVRIALTHKDKYTRLEVIDRLTDPSAREELALRVSEHRVLHKLIKTINDKAVLERIAAAEGAHSSMRAAAAHKAGSSWESLVNAAVAPGATGQMMGGVVDAVLLLYGDGETTARLPVTDIDLEGADVALKGVCERLIRRGDVGYIPALVKLLALFGDEWIVEKYMNCGQTELSAAGRKWASSNGFRIEYTYGASGGVKWGGK